MFSKPFHCTIKLFSARFLRNTCFKLLENFLYSLVDHSSHNCTCFWMGPLKIGSTGYHHHFYKYIFLAKRRTSSCQKSVHLLLLSYRRLIPQLDFFFKWRSLRTIWDHFESRFMVRFRGRCVSSVHRVFNNCYYSFVEGAFRNCSAFKNSFRGPFWKVFPRMFLWK